MITWVELGLFGITCSIFGALLIRNRRLKTLPHENPKVQGVNRLESRTSLAGFQSETEARHFVLQNSCSPFHLSISGVWKFKLYDSFQAAAEARIQKSKLGSFVDIEVPSHWQLRTKGDLPAYNNFKNSIPVDPPNVPSINPTGYYIRHFDVSKEWTGRKISLTFGGVDNAFYVWLNHKYLGFSKDSKLPAEFEVTDFVKCDEENSLEVIVVKYSDGFYLEDQEKWTLSGIYKDVWLTSFPEEVHISDFRFVM